MEDKETIKEMCQAIKGNNLLDVQKLVGENQDILNKKTVLGSFLDVASTFGKYEMVQYFIQCGIDVNRKDGLGKSSALTTASFKGYLDIVKLLYDHGAILDTSTFEGNPLFAAIYNNHVEVAKFLIDKGIDLTASYAIGKLDSCDALEYAREYGATEIYNYIKDKMHK